MMQSFRQMFAMFTVLFSAGEKLAKSLDHIATYTEEGAESVVLEARAERAKQLADLKRQLEV